MHRLYSPIRLVVTAASLAVLGCSESGSGASGSGDVCEPAARTESACSDGADDDCDGYVDCLDDECDGRSCGSGDGYACLAGACLRPGALPELPRIHNLRVTMRGDTAIVDFEPVANARDYRVYLYPDDGDVLVGEHGEVAVRNAIYRCAGDRPRLSREHDGLNHFEQSLSGSVGDYTRTEEESVLGHVYLTPGADRLPVYRVADPNLRGGYTWEYSAPPAKEFNGAEYVVGTAARDALVAKGMRDDGIAFYVPADGTRRVYRRQYAETGLVVLYTDGPEQQTRQGHGSTTVDFGERFRIHPTEVQGSVPLHRVHYSWANGHDVLAPGKARFEQVLYQGNHAASSIAWPGLRAPATLVIEALDDGCPFPNGYVGPRAAPASDLGGIQNFPTITVDQARLSSGEVYINGQHDPNSRPRPIARAFVNARPEPHPKMDWYQSFDTNADWAAMNMVVDDNIGTRVLRNDVLSAEFLASTSNYTYGPMLGQFAVGSTASVYMVARGVDARIASDSYLHVTMSSDVGSTMRRYPQIMITTTRLGEVGGELLDHEVPVVTRLGPMPFEMLPPGKDNTIIVQGFTAGHELQVQFCHLRGWGVSQQCDRANIYGWHAGHETPLPWDEGVAWTPVPVLGEYAAMDRPVKFDVFASTRRVYLFVEDRPAGCARLPDGQMPQGPVTIVFGTAGYHIEIDESVAPEHSAHGYWQRYHLSHVARQFDDLGIRRNVAAPDWNEDLLPCGTHWFGGATE
jgi:hypothetical protein